MQIAGDQTQNLQQCHFSSILPVQILNSPLVNKYKCNLTVAYKMLLILSKHQPFYSENQGPVLQRWINTGASL